jgi:hypothetical protein
MNKYFLLIFISIFFLSFAQAQEYSFGIKGGGNYAVGGEVVGRASFNPTTGSNDYNTDTYSPESEIGFHAGVFFELSFGKFFIRPEVMFNTITTKFEFVNVESEYSVEKISIPLLFGYNVWGPIDIYGGPAYQSFSTATFDNLMNPISLPDDPFAGQLGVKFNFSRFELDFRYDHTIASENFYEIDVENDSTTGTSRDGVNFANFDDRLNQFLVSLSFKIGDSESKPDRSRGQGCYF